MLCSAAAALVAAASAGSSGNARGAEPVWAPSTLVISGRGWGHGVGMSQWGAYGYAKHGSSYDQILAHYYPGTTLGKTATGKVRVLLADGRKRLTISAGAPFTVRDASGETHELSDPFVLGPDLSLPVAGGSPVTLTPPLAFSAGGAPLELGGRAYQGGFLVDVVNGKLRLVNAVGLQAYLDGVVPAEMPNDWPSAALEAQAVASRTYALAVRLKGKPYDLFGDQRSQVYLGVSGESPATTAAVSRTAGEVVLYAGAPALTYFFSSSGGRTAAITDAWPDAKPLPYLVSVDDPYDTLSPHHLWGPVVVPGAMLARKLKLKGVVLDARPQLNGSGRAAALVVTRSDGTTVSVPAGTVRTALNLRSTWFRVGSIALQRPVGAVTYDTSLTLAGRARGVGSSVVLEERPSGQAWATLDPLTPAADGSFQISSRPTSTTQYRIAAGSVKSAPIKVTIAPQVTLSTGDGSLQGTVRPSLEGQTVELQRLEGEVWTTVTTSSLGSDGSFSATLDLTPGTYRARVAATGFAAGFSEPLEIA
ncbi:MAG: SpoIID/LytB domain-containing protein [Gaiellaceae bacterium]